MPLTAAVRAVFPDAAPAISVEVVADMRAFQALESEWNDLVARAGVDHPFSRHDWAVTWYEAFGGDAELHVVVLRSGRDIAGIAPMMVSRTRMCGLTLRTVSFIYNSHTPRFDLIVDPAYGAGVYSAFWQHLCERQRSWDLLLLCQVQGDSPTLATLPALARRDGYPVGQWGAAKSPYVTFLQGTWNQYESTLKRHHRTNTRSRLNRLMSAGDVRLEIVSSPDALPKALEDGFQLEAAVWKGTAGTAMVAQGDTRHFYGTLAQRFAAAGLLNLIFLTLNGRRIAFAYGIRYRNKLYVLKTAYDPEFAKYSPYNVLCYLLFRTAFDEGLAEYEFLGGSEDWKLNWTSDGKAHSWLYVFSPRLRTRLTHQLKFRLVPWAQSHSPLLYRTILGVKERFS